MRKIKDLYFGFNDAENYKRSENRKFFNKVFLIDEKLDELLKEGKYFLVGEKGTGKTACSVYLTNNTYKQTISNIKYVRETDYTKFVELKKNHHLALSDYNQIWKVIIYLLLAEELKKCINFNNPISGFKTYRLLSSAIQEYFENAFNPEVVQAMEFIENSEDVVKLLAKYLGAESKSSTSVKNTKSTFQLDLLYLQKQFEQALKTIKLNKNFILFIDGIDIRPIDIEHSEYLECVKGLTHAIWEINNDFLAKLTDNQRNRIKVVMLLRPDIFTRMGLQNQNNKIKDNAVLLDWRTTYSNYRQSNLFKMTDRLLANQQDKQPPLGESWNQYFPYNIWNNKKKDYVDSPFIDFLRYSFYRPRDIVSLLDIMKMHVKDGTKNKNAFEEKDFTNAIELYSNYLLGEIKDHLIFYYSDQDYELFLKFFQYLDGKMKFNYDLFIITYEKFIQYIKVNNLIAPSFFETADTFLQFLYELNIICYYETSETESFVRWCFRERNYANINPKVKTHSDYQVHYGLMKALNLGSKLKSLSRF